MNKTPISHPSAWTAGELADAPDTTLVLPPGLVDRLRANLEISHDKPLERIRPDDFPLAEHQSMVDEIRSEVLNARGIKFLKGFPVEGIEPEQFSRIFWGLGTHFGHAVSQSRMGDRLGHVVDASQHPGERGYRSRRELSMHTDSDDIVMMLCVHPAERGGVNQFASASAIYNHILRNRPELLTPLMNGFTYHWRGEEPAGDAPITDYRIPVLSITSGVLSCVYLREFINMAARELGRDLSNIEHEALDYFDEIANSDEYRFDIRLERGDVFIINNYTVLHSRTGFEDANDPARKRHLLRLWLKVPDGRALDPNVRRYYGADGIEPREGAGTVYAAGV